MRSALVVKRYVLCLLVFLFGIPFLSACVASLTTNGLVLHMDAGNNGSSPERMWQPLIGPSDGGILCGLNGEDKPIIEYETMGSGYLWFYNFTADSYGRCGQVAQLGNSIDFDYDEDFTVEIWMRVSQKCPNSDGTGRAILLSDGSLSDGYRFGIRHTDPNSWYLEFVMRDDSGDNVTTFRSSSSSHLYDTNWHQVVAVYDGSSESVPSILFYVNGVSVNASAVSGGSGYDYTDTDDIDFLQNGHGAIGSTYLGGDYPFDGGISIARVYSRTLSSNEILSNYNVGLTEVVSVPVYSTPFPNGLVLNLDASLPGSTPYSNWEACSGGKFNGGDFFVVGSGSLPVIDSDTHPDDSQKYSWFYDFSPSSWLNSGNSEDFGSKINFDYNDDFTIEAWIRVPSKSPDNGDNAGRGIIFSDQDGADGYRFGVRHDNTLNKWYLEMVMRDNTGADDTEKTQFSCLGSVKYDYSSTLWHHVAVVYDGVDSDVPDIDFYVDGNLISDGGVSGGTNYTYTHLDFLTEGCGAVGARYSSQWYPFNGDISVVRVYDRKLSSFNIDNNYDVGIAKLDDVPDFKQEALVSLKLEMDAAFCGPLPKKAWKALAGGCGDGSLNIIGKGCWPVLDCESQSGDYYWYYSFDPIEDQSCGQVRDVSADIDYDYNDDFTIEAWIRVVEKCPESAGRGIIISNQDNLANGYRFGIRHDSVSGKWYLETVMRDNTGVDDADKTTFHCISSTKFDYSDSLWHHVAVVYDGQASGVPSISYYVDGVSITAGSVTGGESYTYSDLDFAVSGNTSIGSRYSDGYYAFNGDISIVKVYDSKLTSSQVSSNYTAGMSAVEIALTPQTYLTRELVLDLDAAFSGSSPDTYWTPLAGLQTGGELAAVGIGDLPECFEEVVDVNDFACYYSFSPADNGDCGLVTDLGADINFDYDDDFTIEAWIRADAKCPETAGRGVVIGNQDSLANGYRFGVRHDGNLNKWYLEMIMRDNTGSDDTEKTQFYCLGSSKYDYSQTLWHHIAVTYNGTSDSSPSIDFYVDGSLISDSGVSGGANYSYLDTDFVTSSCVAVGSRYSTGWYPFSGDISAVRVYRDVLDVSDVSRNYNAGLTMTDVPGKGDMDVIFDSDVTNLLTCESWYRDAGHQLTPYIIESSITELTGTGVDVHMTCPGLGRVPLWPSRVLSMTEHYDWFLSQYGVVPGSQFTDYVFMSKDTLGEMLEHSKDNGIGAFVSYRLNDQHNLDAVDDNPISGNSVGTICQFYYDNPSYRLGTDLTKVDQRVWDWQYQAVRDFVYERIEEICENYDLEGLQLDFLRHGAYFDVSSTTSTQRKTIMSDFIKRVRELVNRTTESGEYKYLGVRIPAFDDTYDQLGLDINDIVEAGVDFINFSNFFHTVQQNELDTLLASVPSHVKTYYEVTNTISWIPPDDPTPRHFRYCTENMLVTTAHLAYSEGVDGISAFNFQYYRPPTTDDTSGYEPPYEVFNKLSDYRQCAADPNQHYVIAEVYDYPTGWVNQLPNSFSQDESIDLDLVMSPPDNGWSGNWRLRIMADSDISGSTWQVKFNGITLTSTTDVSEPYEQQYTPQWDSDNMYKAFTVSSGDFVDGDNTVTVKLTSSTAVNLVYLDLFHD